MKLHSIETGNFKLDGGAMFGVVPKVLWEKTNPTDQFNRIQMVLRCLLMDDGVNRVLVDTGLGSKVNEKFKSFFHIEQSENPLKKELIQKQHIKFGNQ